MAGAKRAKPGDTKWLQYRDKTWYAVMEVPRGLRAKLGKRRLVKSLGTGDHQAAIARRHAALAEFQRIFEGARQATGAQAATGADIITSAALSWRDTLARIEQGDTAAFVVQGVTDPDEIRGIATSLVDEEIEDVEHEHGWNAARTFAGIARGTATPLLMHVEAWLKEGGKSGPLNPRTAAQYSTYVRAMAAWARAKGVSTVEAFTAAVAGRYVTEEFVQKGVAAATANHKIAAASAYWRWMRKRAGVAVNPWSGQSLAKTGGRSERSKRPFTSGEVAALMSGEADAELADAMRVAALSGMRLGELYRLTAADCADGWFRLRYAKSRAGVRRVPTHSALVAIVTRRCAGKAPGDYLFHEAPRVGERSAGLSLRFNRYRQACGVHEKADGSRQSRVDFHSWRRWFITAAKNAGIDTSVVAAVVGHETGHITIDVYSGGPSDALLRACVEAVQLPVV